MPFPLLAVQCYRYQRMELARSNSSGDVMLVSDDWTFTTLPACCARAAEVYGDELFLEDGDTRLSFRDFDAQRRLFARALLA
mmetsp:Transcript_4064/g.7402  ORF Transcript_4064/g.7402 Transcript_4064/m.7402 type:complete len:82 (+) Transcript_4064:272-517(+)